MNIDEFVFVGNTCTADFLNWYYNISSSMFSSTSMVAEDFFFYIRNKEKFNTKMLEYRLYNKSKFYGRYSWKRTNDSLNLENDKTFSVEYGFDGLEKTVELYYRHYEFNVQNYFKVKKRNKNFLKDERKQFFVFHIGDGIEKDYEEKIKEFLSIPYEYKLAIVDQEISFNDEKYIIKSSLRHYDLNPVIDIHLKKYFGLEDKIIERSSDTICLTK